MNNTEKNTKCDAKRDASCYSVTESDDKQKQKQKQKKVAPVGACSPILPGERDRKGLTATLVKEKEIEIEMKEYIKLELKEQKQSNNNKIIKKNINSAKKKEKVKLKSPAELIYDAYPRKVGKIAALKKIKLALEQIKFAELLPLVQAFNAATKQWPESQKQYIPYPTAWFHQGRWEDDQANWIKKIQPTNAYIALDGKVYDNWEQCFLHDNLYRQKHNMPPVKISGTMDSHAVELVKPLASKP